MTSNLDPAALEAAQDAAELADDKAYREATKGSGVAIAAEQGRIAAVEAGIRAYLDTLSHAGEGEPVRYAEALARAMQAKHYPEVTQFEPFVGDLMGLLSQIDNMNTGLVRATPRPDTAEGERVTDHKWFDPVCHESGCQSLVLQHKIEAIIRSADDRWHRWTR